MTRDNGLPAPFLLAGKLHAVGPPLSRTEANGRKMIVHVSTDPSVTEGAGSGSRTGGGL